VADGLLERPGVGPAMVTLEHPMGLMNVLIDFEMSDGQFVHKSAGLIRTCRKLAAGDLFIPDSVWKGQS
jgi:hypothetical protein